MEIRDAAPAAAAACAVLRASITELCVADHRNDPAILAAWLANKTPEIVAGWAAQPDSSLLIAVEGDAALAVGGVKDSGEITLNYVAPAARFRGVSSAMLAALEARAAARCSARRPRTGSICRVDIGTTARRRGNLARIPAIRWSASSRAPDLEATQSRRPLTQCSSICSAMARSLSEALAIARL